ncbi:transposase [Serratia plymuthica]|uniref:Transposase n=1 Tax=Serratia plymuthica TaxID=82996 RepID=A0A7T2WAQ3_SERPL|nr:IS66 family insertion sequence hypothetical protein [Serratia plymuthica]QPS57744.1 IS66 family insertion sequence hypothetical protein [Serratia plymuthica]QPS61757.1 IS66 family insertion sequence hypothetical protein [Serratia plymuthica]
MTARKPRKHYSPDFKLKLVTQALEGSGSIAELARQHHINDNLLFKWIRLWQHEGYVSRPRKAHHGQPPPVLLPVQMLPPPARSTPLPCEPANTLCKVRLRQGELTLTHPTPELLSLLLREMMKGPQA